MGSFPVAIFPIILILILMLAFRWGTARAGAAGYLSAFVLAIVFFGAGPDLLAYAHVKALLLSLDVLAIIWAAFLFYRVADEAGAIRAISNALPGLTPDRGMQALIIGWIFTSFLQGVGGFGVPVAVVSPILVGLGFPPLDAVVIPSIGHGWSVTFGSLGTSFQALLAATGQSDNVVAPPSALFLGVSCIFIGGMVAHAAGGWSAVRRLLLPILSISLVMAAVQYVVAVYGPWNIGAFTGSIAGLVVAVPLAIWFKKRASLSPAAVSNHPEKTASAPIPKKTLVIALSGYVILIAVTLVVQLSPPIKQFLGQIALQTKFPEISTSLGYTTPAGTGRKLVVFGHPGMLLVYSSILAYVLYAKAGLYKKGALWRILNGTVRRVMSSSVSIASMVTMAVIMEHAGMTEALARGLAQGAGIAYPFISAWIGALGAFMTGSNTNSNVLFGSLQMRTAELLNFAVPVILAAQTAGAAIGSVLAPTKVIVGTSTTGMVGREGDVIRKLIVYIAILVGLVGLMAWIGA
jgi:lactate permease